MAEDLSDSKLYATFERDEEFRKIQDTLLAVDLKLNPSLDEERHEKLLLRKLSEIVSGPYRERSDDGRDDLFKLGEYQEQAYLLDPHLETLIAPVMGKFKKHVEQTISNPTLRASSSRVERITLLLYAFIKFRGHKTIG